ncbi:MAG: protein-export chaperone SecB [Rhodospirillales bacterium CG15_BIG_FIL_POST_REV_8_21_14_020_66_15]|nr:MAG: protein-export chaperone SecB [Rhodospirillales bacterium CG15_BIG_FIL_POST_REV_8_21_14_020_66_15]
MSDDTTPETAAGTEEIKPGDQVPLMIHGQYIKDFSFEVPGAPQIFLDSPKGQPDINLNLDVQVEGLAEDVFETVLDLRAESRIAGQVTYIVELKYAGLFTLRVPEQHRASLLFVECPRLMFPFARAILADVTRDGGFQPLVLNPIDFAALYNQNIDKLRSQVTPTN